MIVYNITDEQRNFLVTILQGLSDKPLASRIIQDILLVNGYNDSERVFLNNNKEEYSKGTTYEQ